MARAKNVPSVTGSISAAIVIGIVEIVGTALMVATSADGWAQTTSSDPKYIEQLSDNLIEIGAISIDT